MFESVYNVDLKGKTVFLRCDLNSPIIAGRVAISSRIREHAKTIYFLSEEEAKTVVFSHQGRKGDSDFTDLSRHAKLIKKLIGKPVKFVKWADNYVKAVKEMKNGDIVLIDNVRMREEEEMKLTPEQHAKTGFVKELAPLGDLFVQDALSVCHRSHASVVGFGCCMPSYVGPVLQRDLDALEKIKEISDSKLLVLGGAKVDDSIKIIDKMLSSKEAEKVLVGGLLGELFLKAKGISFGAKEKFFEGKKFNEFIPKARELLKKFGGKIVVPVDLAVENQKCKREEIPVSKLPSNFMTYDIGWNSVELFKKEIKKSKLTVFNGPMGMFERNGFALGTKKVLESIAFSRTFSILGGGDTEKAVNMVGLLPSDFDQLSLAGKALLSYLAGEKLPGLEIIKKKKRDK